MKLSIADLLKGTEEIETAIADYYGSKTNQNASRVLEAVKKQMDQVDYEYRDGRNCLTLIKKRADRQP